MIHTREQVFQVGVKALIHDGHGDLLLLKITRQDGKTYWDLPGGRIDEDESAEDSLKRELYEETGLANLVGREHIGIFMTEIMIPLGDSRHARLLFSVYLYPNPVSQKITTENNVRAEWVGFDKALNTRIDYFPSSLLNSIRIETNRFNS